MRKALGRGIEITFLEGCAVQNLRQSEPNAQARNGAEQNRSPRLKLEIAAGVQY
jgi:hypothetical protein